MFSAIVTVSLFASAFAFRLVTSLMSLRDPSLLEQPAAAAASSATA